MEEIIITVGNTGNQEIVEELNELKENLGDFQADLVLNYNIAKNL